MGNNISYEINCIVTWTWLWHLWSMTVPNKDYGYAECEYCLLFQPLLNAECWSFTKVKFIGYENNVVFCFGWDQKEMFTEFLCDFVVYC
jgi:hypothetical protein